MDIDKLFKMPKLPSGATKRRLPDNPTPDMLKRMKMEESQANGKPAPDIKERSQATTLRSEEEEDDLERIDSFAPGGDADYFAEEDEEGRFFGGGLTSEQKQIMNIFENAEGGRDEVGVQDIGVMNIAAIRRLLLNFERAIDKNQAHRSKYPNDPSKFIDSEADLDAAIKSLLPLSQSPALGYPELVRSGTALKLVELLTHENIDIVIDVVEVIEELTDEDVGNEGAEDDDDDNDDGTKANEKALKLLIEGMLGNSVLELLVSNLARFNETEESDRQGVFHTLGVFENVLAFDPILSRTLVSKTSFLQWLLKRVGSKTHEENRGYAGELLAIILQVNRENRLAMAKLGGVEELLQVLAVYRKRDPVDAEEVEFMENIFDSLCSALAEPEVKQLFLDGEGVELMVIMMKEKMLARSRSIKVLDYAMSGIAGTPSCELFVEALGLKTLFSAFMGKAKKQKNPLATSTATEDATHLLSIMSSLFSNLPSDSPSRVRLLAKFVESEYEKLDKLLEIREGAEIRLSATVKEIEVERQELKADGDNDAADDEDRWYLRKVDGGLFTLQMVDYVLAWICMEDDGARHHTKTMLARKGKGLNDVIVVLNEYRSNVSDDPVVERLAAGSEMDIDSAASSSAGPSQRIILEQLISFLEQC